MKRTRKDDTNYTPTKRNRNAPVASEAQSIPNNKQGVGRPKGSKSSLFKPPKDPYKPISHKKAENLLNLHQEEIAKAAQQIDIIKDEQYKAEVKAAAANGVNLPRCRPKHKDKSKGGRPTKYKGTETCIKIIQAMSVGKGLLDAACDINVLYDTVRRWRKEFPEFSVAVNIGKKLCESWWREMGRNAVGYGASNFNATLWMMNMTNRFNWVRKDERTETVKGESVVKHQHKHVVEEIAKRSSEHTAEVVRILVESGVLSAEAQKPAGSTLH